MRLRLVLSICILMILTVPVMAAGPNLVLDPSFDEQDKNLWATDCYNKDGGAEIRMTDGGVDGRCCYIENKTKNHSYAFQEIDVEPGKTYKLSGLIKAEGVTTGKGANIGVMGVLVTTNDFKDTAGKYETAECFLRTNAQKITIMAALGGYGAEAVGRAWFDNISLVEVSEAEIPAGAHIYTIDSPNKSEKNSNGVSSGWYMLIAFTAVVLTASALYVFTPSKGLKPPVDDSAKQDNIKKNK